MNTKTSVDSLIISKYKEIKESGYKLKFDLIEGFGQTNTKEKVITIDMRLSLIAKQYIFVHEYFHAINHINSKQNNKITFFSFSKLDYEKEDALAVHELSKTDFDFVELFKHPLFEKVKQNYESKQE